MRLNLILVVIIFTTLNQSVRGQNLRMVKDIFTGSSNAGIGWVTNFKGKAYFQATNGGSGVELWKSDGSSTGTVIVKDIYAGSSSSNPSNLIVVNDVLYFIASTSSGSGLWKTDGTDVGTVLVKQITTSISNRPNYLTDVNGTIYFYVYDASNLYQTQLWKSNGTASGTEMVKSFTSSSSYEYLDKLTNLNGTLYFTAYTNEYGREIWKSNGTAAGTVLLKDVTPGVNTDGPNEMEVFNGKLYFTPLDGVHSLWKSDGTTAGTSFISYINAADSDVFWHFAMLNGTIYFYGNLNDGKGAELWKTDGTTAGTVLFKEINPGSNGSNPQLMTEFNGKLYFLASTDATGLDLFVTDGTVAGTQKIKDLYTGISNTQAFCYMKKIGGSLFFTMSDVYDTELWRTDGTAAGTYKVAGEQCKNIRELMDINGTPYLIGKSASKGAELFVVDCPNPTPPANTTPASSLSICGGNSTTLTVEGFGVVSWFTSATSTTPIAKGNSFTTPIINANTSYYVQDSSCIGYSTERTQINVTVKPPIISSIVSQTNLCFGATNGTATIAASGGAAPYTYLWSPGGETTPTISNKGAGTYTCAITDATQCKKNQQVTLIQTSAVTSVLATKSEPTCNGTATGSASINVGGGTSPYTYLWSNGGETTKTITNKLAGTYTCLIKDKNQCEGTHQVVFVDPSAIVPSVLNQTNPACYGELNGSASVGATGGTAPYTYSWNPGGATSASITNIGDGTYTCTVKDAKQCTKTQQVILVQPPYINRGINITLGGTKFTVDEVDATYQWFNCDNNQQIPGANQRSYVSTTSSGRFKVRITKNGCTVESACVDMNSAGIDDLQVNVMEVYPNPSTGEFTIEIPFNATVTITNMLGQEVYSNSVTNGTTLINLTGLTKGVYNIKATTEEGENYLERVVID